MILKVIRTQYDIEQLKVNRAIPLAFTNAIEQDFYYLTLEIDSQDDPSTFVLPTRLAILLLETGDDVPRIIGSTLQLEYIEKIVEETTEYYRIAIRHDHEFQLVYTLVGIHSVEIEKWLRNKI